jgi:hypothetical protein
MPGMLTGLLLNLPITAWLLSYLWRGKHLAWKPFLAWCLGLGALEAALLPLAALWGKL